MKEGLQKELFNRFPQLFKPIFYTYGRNLGIGNGWYPLFEEFLIKAAVILETKSEHINENFSIIQVKEKFGGLRIYTNTTIEEIDLFISKAESKAAKTCEFCGKDGKLAGSGWVKTVCIKHEDWKNAPREE